MKLSSPFMITSRLLPGLKVGNAYIQLAYAKRAGEDGRKRYRWTIYIYDKERNCEDSFSDDDLQSGANGVGGGLQNGFKSLLSFLGAAAESKQYSDRTGRKGENEELFPAEVVAWAAENSDELSMLACELEETPSLIQE